jgi:hypothetical protein
MDKGIIPVPESAGLVQEHACVIKGGGEFIGALRNLKECAPPHRKNRIHCRRLRHCGRRAGYSGEGSEMDKGGQGGLSIGDKGECLRDIRLYWRMFRHGRGDRNLSTFSIPTKIPYL